MTTDTLQFHYSTRDLAESQGPVDFLAHCESEGVEMRSQPTFAQVGEEWVASALVTVRAPEPSDPAPTESTEEQ